MDRLTVTCTSTRRIELRPEPLSVPGEGEVLVETICSSISAGSELLVYRGEFTENTTEENDPINSQLHYPHACGYACVGRVVEVGHGVPRDLLSRLVFSFQPHTTRFLASHDSLILVPASLTADTACFLANMETAVNLVQDAAPLLGERVLVLGQGIVGLLTASLLKEFPLESLVAADRYSIRRQASPAWHVLDPNLTDFFESARSLLPGGADLALELSGSPPALNDALALTGYGGRIVIGSWYGEKRAAIDLGGRFHRSRIKLISSQVSTIAPSLTARWNKARRFTTAWSALERIQPAKWITQRFPIHQAAKAYRLLDEGADQTIQVVFDY